MSAGAKGRARMAKVVKLIADTCQSLAILEDSLKEEREINKNIDPDLTALRTSGACKQDIDRGVVANVALRLFSRWKSDTSPLSKKEAYEIGGAVLGRAALVEDRKILNERFQVLEDLLHFIDSAQGGVSIVAKDL